MTIISILAVALEFEGKLMLVSLLCVCQHVAEVNDRLTTVALAGNWCKTVSQRIKTVWPNVDNVVGLDPSADKTEHLFYL